MKRLCLFILSLALVISTTILLARRAPARFDCVQSWDDVETTITDSLRGVTMVIPRSLPASENGLDSIPFQPYGYDLDASRVTIQEQSADGRYSAELIAAEEPFMRNDNPATLNNRLIVRDSLTGQFHLFPESHLSSIHWSPDSQHIAYEWNDGISSHLTVANADGTQNFSVILPGTSYDSPYASMPDIAWSTDGTYLVFVPDQSHDLYFISIQDREIVFRVHLQQTSDEGRYGLRTWAWSPRGHDFVYWDKRGAAVVSLPNGAEKERFAIAADATPGGIYWSPNGQYMALSYFPKIADGIIYGIFSVDSGLLQQVEVTTFPGETDLANPEWTADSEAFVVGNAQSDPATGGYTFGYVAVLTKDHSVTRFTDATIMRLSPTTGRIAYALSAGQSDGSIVSSVKLMDADGSRPVTLGSGLNAIDDIYFSPDGQYIAASGSIYGTRSPTVSDYEWGPNGFTTLHVQDSRLIWAQADGSQIHTLHYQLLTILKWIPEKHGLLYLAEDNNVFKILLLDPQSNQVRTLVNRLSYDQYRSIPQVGPIYESLNYWTVMPLPGGKYVALKYGLSAPAYGSQYWHEGLYLAAWDGHDSDYLIPDGGQDMNGWRDFEISDVIPSPDGSASLISWEGAPDSDAWELILLGPDGQRNRIYLPDDNSKVDRQYAWTNCSLPFTSP